MSKIVKTDIGKFSQFFPFSATIVTSSLAGRDNAMAVAWHVPVSADPPLYAVGIAADKLSHNMIMQSGEFGVNFMPFDYASLVAATGGPSGKIVDKFKKYKLAKDLPVKTGVPLLSAAYVSFECRLEQYHTLGDHTLFIGRVMAVHQAKNAFNKDGTLNIEAIRPVLYLGRDNYLEIDGFDIRHIDRYQAAEDIGKDN